MTTSLRDVPVGGMWLKLTVSVIERPLQLLLRHHIV